MDKRIASEFTCRHNACMMVTEGPKEALRMPLVRHALEQYGA
jgi:hypothetical protein